MILCAGLVPSRAQRRGAFVAQPAKVRLERLTKRQFPHFYNTAFRGESLVTEEFYPIGWSKDGKFAYYSEPGDEACDCYYAKLVIVDLVANKIAWSFEYDGQEAANEDRKDAPRSIAAFWKLNRTLFSDMLRGFKVEPQGPFALSGFPIIRRLDQLKVDVKLKEKTDEDSRLYGTVTQATVQLISRRMGKLTVWDHTFSEPDERFPLDVDVVGYLKSPFEDRIAAIVIEVYRGYEGPPHVTNIRILGANLSSGFK